MTEQALEKNLLLLREQGFIAIRDGARERFRELLDTHVDVVGDYIAARKKFQQFITGRMTASTMVGHESRVAHLILDSLDELVRAAYRSADEELIVTQTYALTRAESLTLEKEALPLFQRVVGLFELSLHLCMRIEDASLRHRVLQRVCQGQEQFAQVGIEFVRIQKGDPRIGSLPAYGKVLLSAFERPMKEALNRRDEKMFLALLEFVSRLFSRRAAYDAESQILMLEARLERGDLDPPSRPEIEAQLVRLRDESAFYKMVEEHKHELLFGLGAWATRRYNEGELERESYGIVFERTFPLIGGFDRLSRAYLEICTTDISDRHGWSSWEMELRPAGGAVAGWAGKESWISLFYVISALRAIPDAPQRHSLAAVVMERKIPSSTLQTISETVKSIGQLLLENVAKWAVVLPQLGEIQVEGGIAQGIQTKLDLLADFWVATAHERLAYEENVLIETAVPRGVVEAFEDEFRKAWIKYSPLRLFVQRLGSFVGRTDEPDVPQGVQRFGWNTLEQKEWFTEERMMALESIAQHMGQGMGQSETEDVFRKIVAAIDPIQVEDVGQLIAHMDAFMEALPTEERDSMVLLSAAGHALEYELYRSRNPNWKSRSYEEQLTEVGYRGKYSGIPLVDVRFARPGEVQTVVGANLRRLGRWTQFHAGRVGRDLEISIEPVTEGRARELLAAKPDLLRDEKGVEQDEPTAIRRLRKTVHLQAWQRFSFVILDSSRAIRIDLPQRRPPQE